MSIGLGSIGDAVGETVEDVEEGARQAGETLQEGGQDLASNVPSPEADIPDVQAPDVSVPNIGTPEAPDLDVPSPEVDVPDVSAPDIQAPDVSLPSAPDVSVPDVQTPDVSVPDVQTPDVSVPDVSVPEVSTPDVSLPDAPSIEDVDGPDVGIPQSPEVDVPSAGDVAGAGEDVLSGAVGVGEDISQASFEAGVATGEELREVGRGAEQLGDDVAGVGEQIGAGAGDVAGDVGQEIGGAFGGAEDFAGEVGQGALETGRGVGDFAGRAGEGVLGAGRGVEDFFGEAGRGVLAAGAAAGQALGSLAPTSPAPPQPQGPPGFRFDQINRPEKVPVGETFSLEIPITNTGQSTGIVEGSVAGQDREVEIPPGEQRTLGFDLTAEDPGENRYDVELRFPQSGQQETVTVPVVGATAIYKPGQLTAPPSVSLGEDYTVEIPVRNTGNLEGSPTIRVDGQENSQQIPPGQSRTFSFSFTAEETGVKRHEVLFRNPETGESVSNNVPVRVVGPNVQVAETAYPEVARQGQQYTGRVALTNTGQAPANVRVKVGNTTATRTIPPGGSTVVEHQTSNTQTPRQRFTIRVTDAGTGDQIATERVTVQTAQEQGGGEQPPGPPDQPPQQPPEPEPVAEPSLQGVNYPNRVPPGDEYTGQVAVSNTGDAPARLLVVAGDFSRAVTLDPGASRTVEHRRNKRRTGPDQFTVRVMDQQTGDEVGRQQVTVRASPTEQPDRQPPSQPPSQPPRQQPEPQPSQPPQQPAPQPIVVQPPQQPAPQPRPQPRQPRQPSQPPGDDDGIELSDLLNPLFPIQVLLGEEP